MTRWSLNGFNARCGGVEPPDAKRYKQNNRSGLFRLYQGLLP